VLTFTSASTFLWETGCLRKHCGLSDSVQTQEHQRTQKFQVPLAKTRQKIDRLKRDNFLSSVVKQKSAAYFIQLTMRSPRMVSNRSFTLAPA
jgi:hypothetical protein